MLHAGLCLLGCLAMLLCCLRVTLRLLFSPLWRTVRRRSLAGCLGPCSCLLLLLLSGFWTCHQHLYHPIGCFLLPSSLLLPGHSRLLSLPVRPSLLLLLLLPLLLSLVRLLAALLLACLSHYL